MPHTIKGQRAELYRPSVGRSVGLASIIESPVKNTRVKQYNYTRNNLQGLIVPRNHYKYHGPNVPPFGAPRNRIPLRNIVNSARVKYAKARTPAAQKEILNTFVKNHTQALNILRRKHINQLEELKAMLRQTPENRLTRSLNARVKKLLANLRKPTRPQR